ncbi:MAG: pitrilysin family protein [Peptostreptococcales bacterium]
MKSEVIKKNLKNNLRFVHVKNKSNNIVINLYVGVGSFDETLENNGISHFIEHLLWQGTKNNTGLEIRTKIKDLDSSYNAYTAFKRTCYTIRGPRRHYEKLVKILLDVIQNPLFDLKEIERERNVILDEYKRGLDDPHTILHKKIHVLIFKDTNFSNLPIGTFENISSFTRDDLINFYKKHYFSNNIVISVSGNLETPEKVIEKHFFLEEKEPTKRELKKSEFKGIHTFSLNQGVLATHFGLVFKSVDYFSKDYPVFEIIDYLLDFGKEVNLLENIRQNLGLSYSINSSNHSFQENGYLSINTTVEPEKIDFLKESIFKELEKLKSLSLKELNFIKRKIKKDYKSIKKYPFIIETLAVDNAFFGKEESIDNKIKLMEDVTCEDIKRVSETYFNDYLIGTISPK